VKIQRKRTPIFPLKTMKATEISDFALY